MAGTSTSTNRRVAAATAKRSFSSTSISTDVEDDDDHDSPGGGCLIKRKQRSRSKRSRIGTDEDKPLFTQGTAGDMTLDDVLILSLSKIRSSIETLQSEEEEFHRRQSARYRDLKDAVMEIENRRLKDRADKQGARLKTLEEQLLKAVSTDERSSTATSGRKFIAPGRKRREEVRDSEGAESGELTEDDDDDNGMLSERIVMRDDEEGEGQEETPTPKQKAVSSLPTPPDTTAAANAAQDVSQEASATSRNQHLPPTLSPPLRLTSRQKEELPIGHSDPSDDAGNMIDEGRRKSTSPESLTKRHGKTNHPSTLHSSPVSPALGILDTITESLPLPLPPPLDEYESTPPETNMNISTSSDTVMPPLSQERGITGSYRPHNNADEKESEKESYGPFTSTAPPPRQNPVDITPQKGRILRTRGQPKNYYTPILLPGENSSNPPITTEGEKRKRRRRKQKTGAGVKSEVGIGGNDNKNGDYEDDDDESYNPSAEEKEKEEVKLKAPLTSPPPPPRIHPPPSTVSARTIPPSRAHSTLAPRSTPSRLGGLAIKNTPTKKGRKGKNLPGQRDIKDYFSGSPKVETVQEDVEIVQRVKFEDSPRHSPEAVVEGSEEEVVER